MPYRGTMIGAALGGGREINRNPLRPGETMNERLEKKVTFVFLSVECSHDLHIEILDYVAGTLG